MGAGGATMAAIGQHKRGLQIGIPCGSGLGFQVAHPSQQYQAPMADGQGWQAASSSEPGESYGPWQLSVDSTDEEWRQRQQAAYPVPSQQQHYTTDAVPSLSTNWQQSPPQGAPVAGPQPYGGVSPQHNTYTPQQPQPQPLSLSQRNPYEQIPAQQVFAKSPAPEPALDPAHVERLVNRILYAVLDRLNDDHFVSRFTKTKELLEDNRQLASQMQVMAREKREQESELAYLRQQLGSFKKVLGNIYLKVE